MNFFKRSSPLTYLNVTQTISKFPHFEQSYWNSQWFCCHIIQVHYMSILDVISLHTLKNNFKMSLFSTNKHLTTAGSFLSACWFGFFSSHDVPVLACLVYWQAWMHYGEFCHKMTPPHVNHIPFTAGHLDVF